ncbi:unnamed protein product [Strongylus vulgaris]|uniref:PHD-type domain-containing protein n=1 Tax=Strongylus vulgaris TaxID=40348 RepID=A0A3P7LQ14_STRVU|nr:unnamed protein product [Strongylus vulgaris]
MEIIAPDVTTLWFTRIRPSNFSSGLEHHLGGTVRSCLSSLGPDKYDDSDALNDQIFNPFEALNGCITCGVHCHRLCAGPPWSTYTPDGDGEEEKWQCDDCR